VRHRGRGLHLRAPPPINLQLYFKISLECIRIIFYIF
jgi:hypothetical protein